MKNPTTECRGYIYALYASDEPWRCRYIGKTLKTPVKRLNEHIWEATKEDKQSHRVRWIRTVESRGAAVFVRTLEMYEGPKVDVHKILCEQEIAWISVGRRLGWRLTNGTDGGDGALGIELSPESLAKRGAAISVAKMGHEVSEEARAKISAAFAEKRKDKTHCPNGHEYTEDSVYVRPNGRIDCRICNRDRQREKRGFGQPRKPHSDEARANMSAAQKGFPKSQEHKDALSAAAIAKRPSHCPQGHEYNEENMSISYRNNGREHISCKVCNRLRTRETYRRDHPGSKHYDVD